MLINIHISCNERKAKPVVRQGRKATEPRRSVDSRVASEVEVRIMKKFVVLACAAMLVFGMAGMASAYQFDMGAGSTVGGDAMTDPGLVMWAVVNPNLDFEIFNLAEGESHTFDFATIGTNEVSVDLDDWQGKTIVASVDFDNPDLIEDVNGTSFGWSFLGFVQGFEIVWEDLTPISFGNGGEFSLTLSDASFAGLFSPQGSVNITATVTLNTEPVPEPSTVLLLGAGVLGLIGLGCKKFKK